MKNILNEIFENKKRELQRARKERPLEALMERAEGTPPPRDFVAAFRGGGTAVIAEIKFKSPSGQVVVPGNEAKVAEIAKIYQEGGAVAISVLTEEKYFMGKLEYLRAAREAVELPLLRKDFILDPYQVYEARAFGADAFLLIADYLDRESLETLITTGKKLGLAALVEVHSEESLLKAVDLPADLLGINNRDLKTLRIDLSATFSLMKNYAGALKGKIVVSESGIRTREEIVALEETGVRGFLIGTTLMKSAEPLRVLREFTGCGAGVE